MISYNVANLENSLKFSTFLSFINKFEIFFLFETHVTSDRQLYFSTFFKNYSLHWISASKVHKAGRASGGCLFGFKKSIQKKYSLKFVNIGNNVILSLKFNEATFFMIPRYLNCLKWKTDFENFEAFLNDLTPSSYCILGDLNARIGEEQIIDYNNLISFNYIGDYRRSKDKTVNAQGRRLMDLIDNVGGIVLNGRTVGDFNGDFTFSGVMGSSVIDYCIASYDFLDYVEELNVASKPFSDHMPLCLSLKILKRSSSSNTDDRLQKLYWNNKFTAKYKENLGMNTSTVSGSVDEMSNAITSKIRNAYPHRTKKTIFIPKRKWFDWKCFRSRSIMSKNLKKFRKYHTASNRYIYYTSRSRYLRICDDKEIQHYNNNLKLLDNVKSSKDWWSLSNSFKTKSLVPNNSIHINSFFTHFSTMLQSSDDVSISWCMPFKIDSLLDSPIEMWELYSVLKTLKQNKSPGLDGIPYEFYRFAPHCLVEEILSFFNKVFLYENIPNSFKESILIPLFKKGDPNLASNYRGLSLINTIGKIFNNILLNRITFWLESNSILNEFQAGFRRQYSTIDNIFNLVSIVNLNSLVNNCTYAFFVDFSCAFDTIPRNSLFYKLSSIGLSSKIIRILMNLYLNSRSRVWDGSTFSDYLTANTGVKQGCILSPILFSLYINDLPDMLPDGVTVAGVTVKVLLYADDIVILSNSPSGLQNMINSLQSYCNMWSLKVNLSKSKVMVFRKGPRISKNLKWTYGDEDIQIVNSYMYLGVDLSYNLSFKKHLQSKLSCSKVAISSCWSKYINNPNISRENKLKIFEAASKSIMCYASQVWGHMKYDDVEKLFRFFIKKMLFLPANSPNYLLYLETGYHCLFASTLGSHFVYINKVLSLGQDRLPRILAMRIISLNKFWAKDWSDICNKIQFIPPDNQPLSCHGNEIIRLLQIKFREECISDALNSQFHDLYSILNYNMSPMLLTELSTRAISLITKARGGLLNLNGRCFRNNTDGLCTICNFLEPENTFHFIGICPAYKDYRKIYLGKNTLDLNEVINILNGMNYKNLYLYLEACLKLRNLIINEFF